MSMLTKLKYAGVSMEDLLIIYKQFIRGVLEYCSVAFHSSLTEKQSAALERCQSVCLRVILQESYISYSVALQVTGIQKLSDRRLSRCLDFSLKCLDHPQNRRIFPPNQNIQNVSDVRNREYFEITAR